MPGSLSQAAQKGVLLWTPLCSLTQVQRIPQHCGTELTMTAILIALVLFFYIHCFTRTCFIFLPKQNLSSFKM